MIFRYGTKEKNTKDRASECRTHVCARLHVIHIPPALRIACTSAATIRAPLCRSRPRCAARTHARNAAFTRKAPMKQITKISQLQKETFVSLK